MEVNFVEGKLSTFKSDVIVNSTNQRLSLQQGLLSASVAKAAGPDLQKECARRYPNGICFGEVAPTDGHALTCKRVYHVALPSWDTPFLDPQKILCEVVCNCLRQANKEEMTSIAFPALGCGFLNFPEHVVMNTIFSCVSKVKKEESRKTIKKIVIVVFKKGADWGHIKQAFMTSFSRLVQPSAPSQSIPPANGNTVKDDLLSTCRRLSATNACGKTLACGHVCPGFKQETTCPPCLYAGCKGGAAGVSQSGEDNCAICYTDSLREAPVVMLKCGHLFHLHCTERILQNKWVGPRIVFNFMHCPLCKAPIEHPNLASLLTPLMALKEDVQRKARTRLQFEGLEKSEAVTKATSPFYRKPEEYAMDRYCYYQCFKCKKAYFGGAAQCEDGAGDHAYKEEELVCPACSGPQHVQNCAKHGTDYLEYKCRYCCSVAVFFCHGNTHYCNACHNIWMTCKEPHPTCPVGPGRMQLQGACPLGVKHPPTGEEFCLGCALCSNLQSF